MLVRQSLFSLLRFRMLLGLLLTFGFCTVAQSQQIPCPVTTSFTNSSTAINAESPCDINAGLTNNVDATFENEVSGTLNNNAGIGNYGVFTNNGMIMNNANI